MTTTVPLPPQRTQGSGDWYRAGVWHARFTTFRRFTVAQAHERLALWWGVPKADVRVPWASKGFEDGYLIRRVDDGVYEFTAYGWEKVIEAAGTTVLTDEVLLRQDVIDNFAKLGEQYRRAQDR